jgi:hypothetical protein
MTIARFNGAEAWARLTPAQQAEIGSIAVELVIANIVACRTEDHHTSSNRRDALVFRASLAAGEKLVIDLDRAVTAAVVPSIDFENPPVPSRVGDVCQTCGCTNNDACRGGCAWAKPGQCTACEASHSTDKLLRRVLQSWT